ncbi:MAG TPA: hypothetical protein VNC17_09100 [Thermoleophilaceae bacterium]|jgi:hypothetical protein|nr:hypothetical protein [Thermoleophilaceae bacterium]
MGQGANTPEELETLLEDAFVLQDRDALVELFDEGAVLVAESDRSEARGAEAIARSADALWGAERIYVAEPGRVLQARDTALVFGGRGVSVLRRGHDGAWRYAISVLSFGYAISKEEQ